MPLPKRLRTEELETNGFTIIASDTALHTTWQSKRYKCYRCGHWVNQAQSTTYGSIDRESHWYCPSCYGKTSRRDYIPV